MKRLLPVLLFLAVLPLSVPQVRADDSDIFGANIDPNILIFVDSSGSMDDYIDQASAAAYSPTTTYTGSKTAAVVYYCSRSNIDDCENNPSLYQLKWNTVSGVPLQAAKDSLNSSGKWSGKISGTSYQLRTGNYLNYHFSSTGGHEQKIVIARRVIKTLIDSTDNVRFGLAKFTGNSSQGPGGAAIIADIGSTKTALKTAVDGITSSGYTPLKGALYDMGVYYKGNLTGHPGPIQYSCQPNYIIMMSDGLQNGYGDVRAEATLRRTQDHFGTSSDGIQNVVVDTIGFAVAATEADAANDVLQTTATNGGGQFYSTSSEAQLESALEDAVRRIMAATFAFATPVVPTTSATGLTRSYIAAFQTDPASPFWNGYLKAYNRDSSGNVPTDANGTPLDSALAWEAGQKLTEKSSDDRTIYTAIGTTRQLFRTDNTSISATDLGFAGADATDANKNKVINFIRGKDVNGATPTLDRGWKLGDIYHSTPVVVTPPFLPSSDSTYNAFKIRSDVKNRTTVLLTSSNDGMLHAFRESDGVELWAFIAPGALPQLKSLMVVGGEHQFLLDSSPVVSDVKIGGSWKTIVVFGERRGGPNYYALDITNTEDPQFLWTFTDSKIAESWSEPVIGKVKMNSATGSTEKYVVILGGGYDTVSNNSHGKAVFILDASDKTTLWQYYNDGSTGNDRSFMNFSIPANPLAIDVDGDGFIDHVYIGDLGGQLWKFDVSAAATLTGGTTGTVTNWTGKRLFRAGSDATPAAGVEYFPSQAIYAAPDAAFDDNKKLWLFFGTGDRNHPLNTASNRFYGIKDDPYTDMTNGSVITESTTGMSNATGLTTVPTVGWYFLLSSSNKEKVLARANVFNKVVYFTSFLPSGSAACGGGGVPRLYAVYMTTAYAAINYDTNHVYDTSELSNSNTRYKEIGYGIASMPIIALTETGTTLSGQVITGSSGGGVSAPLTLLSNPLVPPTFTRRVLYWKEVY